MEQSTEPALRVRAVREASRDPLTQEHLATVTGLSRRHVQELEAMTELAKPIEALLRVTIALQVNLHELICPRTLRRLVYEVAGRRSAALPC